MNYFVMSCFFQVNIWPFLYIVNGFSLYSYDALKYKVSSNNSLADLTYRFPYMLGIQLATLLFYSFGF